MGPSKTILLRKGIRDMLRYSSNHELVAQLRRYSLFMLLSFFFVFANASQFNSFSGFSKEKWVHLEVCLILSHWGLQLDI